MEGLSTATFPISVRGLSTPGSHPGWYREDRDFIERNATEQNICLHVQGSDVK